MRRGWGAGVAAGLLAGCTQTYVAPYNAGLQQQATALLTDVSAFDAGMYAAAGTAAADPRGAAVQDKLAAWSGSIEAMAAVEAGIDPGSTRCDHYVGAVVHGATVALGALAAVAQAGGTAAPAKCESLPDILGRMQTEVRVNIPTVLEQQCVPKDAAGNDVAPLAAKAADYAAIAARCQALFTPVAGQKADTPHGDAVNALATMLDALIYREAREAPQAGS